eukprot:1249553-Rhodomonas_salina.1
MRLQVPPTKKPPPPPVKLNNGNNAKKNPPPLPSPPSKRDWMNARQKQEVQEAVERVMGVPGRVEAVGH